MTPRDQKARPVLDQLAAELSAALGVAVEADQLAWVVQEFQKRMTPKCWLCDGKGFVVTLDCAAREAYGRKAKRMADHVCSKTCERTSACVNCWGSGRGPAR